TLLLGSALAPTVAPPVVALDHTDEIEERAAPQRVGDHVAARSVPVGADRTAQLRRQPGHGDNAAPGHQAGEVWFGRTEQVRAQPRVHAVGTDHHVALDASATLEFEDGLAAALGAGDGAAGEIERARPLPLHGLPEDAMEVAAMHHPIRRAEA